MRPTNLEQLKQMIYSKQWTHLLYSNWLITLVDFCIQDKFPFLILGKACFVCIIGRRDGQKPPDATEYFIGTVSPLLIRKWPFRKTAEAIRLLIADPSSWESMRILIWFMLEENSYKSWIPCLLKNWRETQQLSLVEGVRGYLSDKQMRLQYFLRLHSTTNPYWRLLQISIRSRSGTLGLQIIKDYKEKNKTVTTDEIVNTFD